MPKRPKPKMIKVKFSWRIGDGEWQSEIREIEAWYNDAGVRAVGSSLDRFYRMHECEPNLYDGVLYSNFAKANGDSEVQYYTRYMYYNDPADPYEMYLMGYFGSEIDYQELWQTLTITQDGTWEAKDCSSYLDQDGRVVNIVTLNTATGSENIIGVRGGDNTGNRYYEEHEAESYGLTGMMFIAQSDSDGIIDLYHEDSASSEVYLAGYFKFASVETKSITKYSDARILEIQEITKQSDSRILRTEEITKYSDARIVRTEEFTKNSNAVIFKTQEVSKNSNARILRTEEITKTSDAKVVVISTEEIYKTSDAVVFKEQEITKQSDARVLRTEEISKTSDAVIFKTQSVLKPSDARILRTIGIIKPSDSTIFKVQEITKTSDALIIGLTTIIKFSDARILKTMEITKTSDAKIIKEVVSGRRVRRVPLKRRKVTA